MGKLHFLDSSFEYWTQCKHRFYLYREATEKMIESNKLKIVLLLSLIKDKNIDLFNSFKLFYEDSNKFNVIKCFDRHFEPKENTVTVHCKIFNFTQHKHESVDLFATNLDVSSNTVLLKLKKSLIRNLLIIDKRDIIVKE